MSRYAQCDDTCTTDCGHCTGAGVITIRAPRVPFPGGQTQAGFMRDAADRIEGGHPIGGSNLTGTVMSLLRDVAAALDERDGR